MNGKQYAKKYGTNQDVLAKKHNEFFKDLAEDYKKILHGSGYVAETDAAPAKKLSSQRLRTALERFDGRWFTAINYCGVTNTDIRHKLYLEFAQQYLLPMSIEVFSPKVPGRKIPVDQKVIPGIVTRLINEVHIAMPKKPKDSGMTAKEMSDELAARKKVNDKSDTLNKPKKAKK